MNSSKENYCHLNNFGSLDSTHVVKKRFNKTEDKGPYIIHWILGHLEKKEQALM